METLNRQGWNILLGGLIPPTSRASSVRIQHVGLCENLIRAYRDRSGKYPTRQPALFLADIRSHSRTCRSESRWRRRAAPDRSGLCRCCPLLTSISLWLDPVYEGVYGAHVDHYDNDGPVFLKFFIHLNDVDVDTGAHSFIQGSHIRRKPQQF